MAVKRMFAMTVVDSDLFLDMPLSSQALYFHLSMRADDEGFINNPKKIQRTVGASDGDAEILVTRRFIIPFETGVIVIRHWKLNNYLRSDRFHPTVYQKERAMLRTDETGAYILAKESGIPLVDQRYTENSIDKNRLDKTSIDKLSIGFVEKEEDNNNSNDTKKEIVFIPSTTEKESIKNFFDIYNSIDGVTPCEKLDLAKETLVSIILLTYEPIDITRTFRNLQRSHLSVTFDWFINVENFKNVFEGNI